MASSAPVHQDSVLLITLDSCRHDTFVGARAPNLQGVGPVIHRAQAPSHFTHASHTAIFVGYTPGVAGVREPFVNPKFAKLFRIANAGRQAAPAAFELEGRNVINGFAGRGYRTIGSGALGWFNPETPAGLTVVGDFERFFYPGGLWFVKRQAAWLDAELDAAGDRPVFVFLNVGETHVPYWHDGADWSPADNPCRPFQTVDRRADCAHRQRACLEHVDAALAALIARFAPASVVVTADHGDCWGEDGVWEHGTVHEAVLTVPLVFRLAPAIAADQAARHAREAFRRSPMSAAAIAPVAPARALVQRDPDVVWSAVGADVFGMHAASGDAFQLNETAGAIWALLASPHSEEDICAHLRRRYAVDEATCRESVSGLLARWRAAGLVKDVPAPEPVTSPSPAERPLTLDSVVVLRNDLTLSAFDDDIVIVDAVNEWYHSAGATGSRIVGLLDVERPVRDIVATLTATYDVDRETCTNEVLAFLTALQHQRLLRVTS